MDEIKRIGGIIMIILAIMSMISLIIITGMLVYEGFSKENLCKKNGYNGLSHDAKVEMGYAYCCNYNYIEHIEIKECKAIKVEDDAR